MSLSKLTIGPFDPLRDQRNLVHVNNSSTCVTPGALYDKEMGIVKKLGWPACIGDYAACFGTTGFIVLPWAMLNPGFEKEMVKFLTIFSLEDTLGQPLRLKMLDIIPNLVEKYKSKSGFRKLKAISKSAISTSPWKPWAEGGGVKYKYKEVGPEGKKIDAWKEIQGNTLRDLLRDVCERHIAGEPRYDPSRTKVTLNDLGFNVSISRPTQFVVDVVPIMQNSMRAPLMGSVLRNDCVTTKVHPITTYYKDLVDATLANNMANVRTAWMAILETDEQFSMKHTVFTGAKEAFLRGSMLSKVGGQMARSVVAPNPLQRPDQVGIPRLFAKEVSRRIAVTVDNVDEVSRLIQDGHITHIMHTDTHEYVKIDSYASVDLIPGKMLVLRELADGDVVLINRQPTLHKNSLLAFRVYLHDEDVIYIHPSATTSFGMDL